MRPVVLVILDGWGYSKQKLGNAVLTAETPAIDLIKKNYPSVLLQPSGSAVGLSWGESGNSEVGHLTLGAGRIIFQYLSRINKAIENGNFFTNPELLKAIEHAKKNHSRLHLAGLLTSSSVHSYLDHLLALIELASRNGISDVYLHLFTDGKDSGMKEAPFILKRLNEYISNAKIGKIATLVGRDIAMDRNKNWELTEKTYNLMVKGEGEPTEDIEKKLEEKYQAEFTDINMPPLIADSSGTIKDNDALIFFNFREDRMKQIVEAFTENEFTAFQRQPLNNLYVVCMTQYIEGKQLNIAFPPYDIKNCLAEVISNADIKQIHIAETEKYAHVTFFFNALIQHPFSGENDILITSDKNATEDPAMKAREITETAVNELSKNEYGFMLINYANPDMLSHMGNFANVVKGIEILDGLVEKLRLAVMERDGIMIITSDHGNSEAMTYRSTGEAETKHDPNPVPLYLVAREYERPRSEEEIEASLSEVKGFLSDVAPTVLDLMGLQKPEEMTGESLLSQLSQ